MDVGEHSLSMNKSAPQFFVVRDTSHHHWIEIYVDMRVR